MHKKHVRAVSGDPVSFDDNGRTVRYILSDSSIARDGNRILTDGWILTNFLKNPVFLWAHDNTTPPIGRIVEIGVSGDNLMGTVEYAAAADNPFGDMIYRLVKNRFLNTVSVSWNPLKWKYSSAPGRSSGAIDFTSQELLEVSQVPVPALASALVTARAHGINTGLMADWATKILSSGRAVQLPANRKTIGGLAKSSDANRETVADRIERARQIKTRIAAREEFRRLNDDPDILAMRLIRGKTPANDRERREHAVIRLKGSQALRRKYNETN